MSGAAATASVQSAPRPLPHQPAGSARPQRGSVELMSALLSGDWAVADAASAEPRREASGLIAAHLQWHLERGLRSLPLVDRTPSTRA